LVLLWSQAMNFSVHLNFNLPQKNAVFPSPTAPAEVKSSSWNFGFEYNF
jgi:hypothetical protein